MSSLIHDIYDDAALRLAPTMQYIWPVILVLACLQASKLKGHAYNQAAAQDRVDAASIVCRLLTSPSHMKRGGQWQKIWFTDEVLLVRRRFSYP